MAARFGCPQDYSLLLGIHFRPLSRASMQDVATRTAVEADRYPALMKPKEVRLSCG